MNKNDQADNTDTVEHELQHLRLRAAAFEAGQATLITDAEMRIVQAEEAMYWERG